MKLTRGGTSFPIPAVLSKRGVAWAWADLLPSPTSSCLSCPPAGDQPKPSTHLLSPSWLSGQKVGRSPGADVELALVSSETASDAETVNLQVRWCSIEGLSDSSLWVSEGVRKKQGCKLLYKHCLSSRCKEQTRAKCNWSQGSLHLRVCCCSKGVMSNLRLLLLLVSQVLNANFIHTSIFLRPWKPETLGKFVFPRNFVLLKIVALVGCPVRSSPLSYRTPGMCS